MQQKSYRHLYWFKILISLPLYNIAKRIKRHVQDNIKEMEKSLEDYHKDPSLDYGNLARAIDHTPDRTDAIRIN